MRSRAIRLNRPPRYKLYDGFRLVSGLTKRDSLAGFPGSAPSHALNCTVAYCKPFYSITVAGAASVLFAYSENSPTSHFIPQTTVCGIPEAMLPGEYMRRRKILQAEQASKLCGSPLISINNAEQSIRQRQLCVRRQTARSWLITVASITASGDSCQRTPS